MKKFILIALAFSACVSETETHHVNESKETKPVSPQLEKSNKQESQKDKFPKWLKSRFPDTVDINYAYGYANYSINDFVKLKGDLNLVIVSWDDAVCNLDSAFVLEEYRLISNVSVGHVCDNPSPDFGYEYQKYSLDQEVIMSTTFKEYLPDSVEQKLLNGEEINPFVYMQYDTIVNYYKVDADGQFISF